jgi:hypothetical protein
MSRSRNLPARRHRRSSATAAARLSRRDSWPINIDITWMAAPTRSKAARNDKNAAPSMNELTVVVDIGRMFMKSRSWDHQHRRPRRRRHRADGTADRGEGAGRPDRGGLSRLDAANLQLHARMLGPGRAGRHRQGLTSTRTPSRSLIRSRRRSSRPRPAMLRRPPQAPGAEARAGVAGTASQAVTAHEIGSAVVDLIFSMAKREVTFFSGTAAISRL